MAMNAVVKIGTSSLTDDRGAIDATAVASLCAQIADLRTDGHEVVLVSSGAIAAGVPALGMAERPRDTTTLQAISAVGQSRLMAVYNDALGQLGIVCGQVLLAPFDFFERSQYLQARQTIRRLLELGVVPIINENDAVADDAIRFGDNDRIAALVAHLVDADMLILLTDTDGVLTADPRVDSDASLIEEVREIDHELESVAGATGSERGSGGMASKLAAVKMAAWSGVTAVIAGAHRPDVLRGAIESRPGIGTVFQPRSKALSARKLWIAFALPAVGTITVDAGAVDALTGRGTSLLPVGVEQATGSFDAGAAVEVAGPDGQVFAKGLVTISAADLAEVAGRQTGDLPPGVAHEVIHRDDLVMVP
jgi:glutamate 5-kinase